MVNTCPHCGANLALVGRIHRCVPKVVQLPVPSKAKSTQRTVEPVRLTGPISAEFNLSKSYLYRDIEHRRVYLRDYMRQWRAKRRAQSIQTRPTNPSQ